MTKEATREKFKSESGLEPLTKTGVKSKQYSDWLLSDRCTPPWMSVWSGIYKKHTETPYKTKEPLVADLEAISREVRLDKELCVIGGAGRGVKLKEISTFRRESKEKYKIENY